MIEMENANQFWMCSKCSEIFDETSDFAIHLRTHLVGHRSRKFRNTAKSNNPEKSKKQPLFQSDTPILKFDNISTCQLEITQPNSVFNIMNGSFESREMCKQLVDPSLVMPSKTRRTEETNEFNYTEMLNFNQNNENQSNDNFIKTNDNTNKTNDNTNKTNDNTNKTNDNTNKTNDSTIKTKERNTNNKLHYLTKDLNLESPTKECVLEQDSNYCATITPLNLYYIDEQNYNGAADINMSGVDEVQQSNVVLVDNSVDETVKSMRFDGQIVTGDPIQIVPLNAASTLNAMDVDDVFDCEICLKKFAKATYLHRHLQNHIGEYTCQYCDREFARKETWVAHSCQDKKLAEHHTSTTISTKATSDVIHPIEIRLSSAVLPGLQQASTAKAIRAKKIYRCEICDVTIKDRSGWNKHMITHSETCYTCVYCDTTVKHRHSIRKHLQKAHREYEHEWNNSDFISILQTDTRRETTKNKSSKKKKRTKKLKQQQQDSIKMSQTTTKKDRLIVGALSDELKLKFESNSSNKNKTSQISDYLNCETSVNSVRDDSSDLLSFTKHFDDDIAHTSFQALTLPDVNSKSFELSKVDSKDGVQFKNFNVSPVMLLNKKRTSSNDCSMEISPDKSSSSFDVDRLQKFFSTPIKDKCVFFESPLKTWGDGKIMPSMPILFCEDESVEMNEKDKNGVMVVCKPLPEKKLSPIKSPKESLSSMIHQEDPNPSCSAGYVLEESPKSSMHLMDTSTDFTFFVLS